MYEILSFDLCSREQKSSLEIVYLFIKKSNIVLY